jgi:hypothetical protein
MILDGSLIAMSQDVFGPCSQQDDLDTVTCLHLVKDFHRQERPSTLYVIEALGDLILGKTPIGKRAANPAGDRFHTGIYFGASRFYIKSVATQPVCGYWPKTS